MKTPYENCRIYLTTKHKKEEAIAPVFKEILTAEIVSCNLDTDTLGTFTEEVARSKTALECALCGLPTTLVKIEVFGCHKCSYEEFKPRADALLKADPSYCLYCNP